MWEKSLLPKLRHVVNAHMKSRKMQDDPVRAAGPDEDSARRPDGEAKWVSKLRISRSAGQPIVRLSGRWLMAGSNKKLQHQKQYKRSAQKSLWRTPSKPPSDEWVTLHEVTHLSKAVWCEACIAVR